MGTLTTAAANPVLALVLALAVAAAAGYQALDKFTVLPLRGSSFSPTHPLTLDFPLTHSPPLFPPTVLPFRAAHACAPRSLSS